MRDAQEVRAGGSTESRYTGSVSVDEFIQRQQRLRLLMKAAAKELTGFALVDRLGHVAGLAGAVSEEEAMPLAALVMYRLKSDDLAERLFKGEVISLMLDERAVAVAIAKRQLFVVAVHSECTPELRQRTRVIRDCVEQMLSGAEPSASPPFLGGGGGGGGAGPAPAESQLIEFGVTVPRVRPKA